MTNEYLFDPFLTQYYLLEAVCENFLSERERARLFRELAAVFCVDGDGELEEYYRLSHEDPYREIRNLPAYERFCRTVEFAQRSGQQVDFSDRDRIILAQKREAMEIKAELFRQARNLTRETVTATLLNAATNGNVNAMTLVSFMEYHGVCFCKDRDNALRRIRHCARWNNLFGNLMGLAYDEDGQRYIDILGTVLRNASQKRVFDHICRRKGWKNSFRRDPAARLVEDAFGIGVIHRKAYDRTFAKVAFSQMISAEDKGKLLLTKQKDAVAMLSDIPFDAASDPVPAFDRNGMKKLPLIREAEVQKILRNLTVAETCPPQVYAPLMVVAHDDYVANMYADGMKRGFGEDRVVEVDAATLTERDFAGSGEHLLLRGLSETKNARTVFLIRNCEELSAAACDEMEKLLDYGFRKKFKLFQPPVSLDLSGLVFILLASSRTPQVTALSRQCDTLWAERLREEERPRVVDSVFRTRARCFGSKAKLETGCREYLAAYEPAKVQQIVDHVLRRAVFENLERVPLAVIKEACEECNATVPSTGFGYRGGTRHA